MIGLGAIMLGLLAGQPAWTRQASAVPDWAARDAARLSSCLALSGSDPEAAYEEGLAWRFSGGGQPAGHCLGAALIARGDYEGGASVLLDLANAPDGGSDDNRALLLSKAANAWMLAGDPRSALMAANRALELAPGTPELRADQAMALALLNRWAEAQAVLDGLVADGRADAMLYRLRAETHLQQGQHDAADSDVAAAIALAPQDIENYVVRGRAREARRLGRAPD